MIVWRYENGKEVADGKIDRYYEGIWMKRAYVLISLVLILILAGCASQAQAPGAAFQPPLEGIQWGMTPEEAVDVLSLSEECIQNPDEWTAVLLCDDMEVFGWNADVELVFESKYRMGLQRMTIWFEEDSEESLAEMLSGIYGEHSAVDAGGVPSLWESEKVEDLTEEIQDRFRSMWLDYSSWDERQGGISQETVWDSYKSQPLVSVVLNGDVLSYYGGNMAAYLIYNDDIAYEKLQSLRNSN